MSKARVNDEIVLMRKTVRQGKVHIIRKLVREIRTLKSKKPPADGPNKYTEKAERLYEELAVIKKINCDEISKYALTVSVDPQQMLSKSDISIKDRALNRLAAHKFIREKVKTIKEKHNISDNIEKVLEPGKKKLRKLKHIEGKAKKKQQKLENASAEMLNAKRQEWLDTQKKQNRNENEIKEERMIENAEMETEIGIINQLTSDENKREKLNKETKIESDEDGENEMKVDSDNEIDEDDDDEIEDTEENDDDDEVEEPGSSECESEKEMSSEAEQEDSKTQNNTITTIDDFFLTDSGSHYKSTFIPKSNVQVQTHTDGLNRQQRRAQMHGKPIKKKSNKYKNDKPYAEDKRGVKQKFTKAMASPGFNKPLTDIGKTDKASSTSKKFIKEKKEVSSETASNTALHPSWEAKKKQKPQITAFQGKKIVFDD